MHGCVRQTNSYKITQDHLKPSGPYISDFVLYLLTFLGRNTINSIVSLLSLYLPSDLHLPNPVSLIFRYSLSPQIIVIFPRFLISQLTKFSTYSLFSLDSLYFLFYIFPIFLIFLIFPLFPSFGIFPYLPFDPYFTDIPYFP